MKFDDLDSKMRLFETSLDQTIIPGVFIIARLDGRGFTKLTKEILDLEKPFDIRFHDAMAQTVTHLMSCGFRILYGYTQSDEISLLLHPEENLFDRKFRKLISILAGEASARFSMSLGTLGVFDCRLSLLPSADLVKDYFRWRQADAYRNSLNAYCYWKLREQGVSQAVATGKLSGMSVAEKNELLYQLSINYNSIPEWQKRGTGFYYKHIMKEAFNPVKGECVSVARKVLFQNDSLPLGEEYDVLISKILEENNNR